MKAIADIKNTQTLINLVKKFVDAGILVDASPGRVRNKIYIFAPLMEILDQYGQN